MKALDTRGFEVKALKEYSGHEGELVYGANLYKNNRKVGSIMDSFYGGEVSINLTGSKNVQRKLFNELKEVGIERYKLNNDFMSVDCAFSYLVDLKVYAKLLKKQTYSDKKGIVVFNEKNKYNKVFSVEKLPLDLDNTRALKIISAKIGLRIENLENVMYYAFDDKEDFKGYNLLQLN